MGTQGRACLQRVPKALDSTHIMPSPLSLSQSHVGNRRRDRKEGEKGWERGEGRGTEREREIDRDGF